MSDDANNELPSRKDYRLSRAKLLTEGYKGLLMVNGGGAAALLAFVQAVWQDRALANLALTGLGFMIAGLFFAMLVPFLRFHHSWDAERKQQGDQSHECRRKLLRFLFTACQYLSALAFVVGAGYLIWKGLAIK